MIAQIHHLELSEKQTRTLLAGMAMQGWIVAISARYKEKDYSDSDVISQAARYANYSVDALLAELEKKKTMEREGE